MVKILKSKVILLGEYHKRFTVFFPKSKNSRLKCNLLGENCNENYSKHSFAGTYFSNCL
jgi:hypothetical protein